MFDEFATDEFGLDEEEEELDVPSEDELEDEDDDTADLPAEIGEEEEA